MVVEGERDCRPSWGDGDGMVGREGESEVEGCNRDVTMVRDEG